MTRRQFLHARELRSFRKCHRRSSRKKPGSQYFAVESHCWDLSIDLKVRNGIRNTSLMRYWKAFTQSAIQALDTGSEGWWRSTCTIAECIALAKQSRK
jgi:hypothetical protein